MLIAASIVLCAASAHAQSAEAQATFNDGDRLMKVGKLAEACEAFETSNRLEPRAGTLIRLGGCREENHQLAPAWSAYKHALTRVTDPSKKQIASGKVAELEPRLSYLTIAVAPAANLADLAITRNGIAVDAGLWNRAVPIDGGSYAIAVHAPGRREWQTTATVPIEGGKVTIDVPALERAPDDHHDVAVTNQPLPPARAQASSTWTGTRTAAVVAAAAAVAGVGAGVAFGVLAKRDQHDGEALCSSMICASPGDVASATADLAAARSRALDANSAFGVAGGAAIAAVVLWFVGAPPPGRDVAIAPAWSSGPGIAVAGRF